MVRGSGLFAIAATFCCLSGLGVFGCKIQASTGGGPVDWLLPKVCADKSNRPLSVDPYPHCPSGSRLRNIALSDPLPYRKMDQTSETYKDIYPRLASDGTPVIVATLDWIGRPPQARTNFDVGEDGYDLQVVKGGWAAVGETRSGSGEFATSFFTTGCKDYGGLILFPDFLNGSSPSGSHIAPVATVPWEVSGANWPGRCPSYYVSDQITDWQLIEGLKFGLAANGPVKKLDSMVTTMGYRTSKNGDIISNWNKKGHLERFYFTKLYGLSRWESWVPVGQFGDSIVDTNKNAGLWSRSQSALDRCILTDGAGSLETRPKTLSNSNLSESQLRRAVMTYRSQKFAMTDCRDWTNIVIQKSPDPPAPWPVSALNFLKNFHFAIDFGQEGAFWINAGLESAIVSSSTSRVDTQTNSPYKLDGVSYVRIDCRSKCTGHIYQDLPLSSQLRNANGLIIGSLVRSDLSQGALEFRIIQMDSAGNEISSSSFVTDKIPSKQTRCFAKFDNCKSSSFNPSANEGSVILSSTFVSRNMRFTPNKSAQHIRLEVFPRGNDIIDISSIWLMRSYFPN